MSVDPKDPNVKRDLITGEIIKGPTFENLHPGQLKTRRDFLSAGLIQMTASVTLPSVAAMMAKSGVARAQEIVCPKGGNSALVPFVSVNLAGGAGLSGNFVVHDQGNQPLQSYSKLGLGKSPIIQRAFVNQAPFAGNGISQFLVGLLGAAQISTVEKAALVGAPIRTRDDSAENKLNLEGMVAKAGRAGTILPHLGRNRNAFAFVPPPNPLNVQRFNNIQEALAIGGRLGEKLSKNQQAKLFKAIETLTSDQTRGIASKSGGSELSQLINCATKDNTALVGNADPGVDPSGDAAFMGVWGNPNMNSNAFTQAAIVYNVIKGNAAAASINLGGYDYHNGSRTTGDQKDLEAGTIVGQILQSFAIMGTKGFITVTSDGAVTGPMSDTAGSPWTSDRGSAGMAYMIAYDPMKPVTTNGTQMGYFLGKESQQAVDQSFVTSGTAEMGAAGMFANYLSFSGQLGLLDAVLPRVFTKDDLDLILKLFA